jgi:hypothetical protein
MVALLGAIQCCLKESHLPKLERMSSTLISRLLIDLKNDAVRKRKFRIGQKLTRVLLW